MIGKIIIVVLITLMLLPTGFTVADEPLPETPQDNACYEGGSMWREKPEDRCSTLWHWVCGWYLARYTAGIFTRHQVIDQCESVLPPLPPEEIVSGAVDAGICFDNSNPIQHDILMTAAITASPNAVMTISKDGTCTGGVNMANLRIVQAPDQATADAACGALSVDNLVLNGWNAPADYWRCP